MKNIFAVGILTAALALGSVPVAFAGVAQQQAALTACNAVPKDLAGCAVALSRLSAAEFAALRSQLTGLTAAELADLEQSVTFQTAAIPDAPAGAGAGGGGTASASDGSGSAPVVIGSPGVTPVGPS